MIVTMNQESWSYQADTFTYEKLLSDIEEALEGKGLLIDKILVDHETIDVDLESYLRDNMETVKLLQIETIGREILLERIQRSVQGYLERAIPEISNLAESFYQNPNEKTWGMFGEFVDAVQWMLNYLETISSITGNEQPLRFIRFLQEKTVLLSHACEGEDFTLVGDVLNFEFKPVFEELLETIAA